MDLLAFVQDELKKLPRQDWPGIAKEADVAPSTMAKIVHGHVDDPGVRKVQALADVLRRRAEPAHG